MIRIHSFLLAMLLAAPVLAQDREQLLQFSLGYHGSHSQDQVFSPLIYKGGAFGAMNLAYENLKDRRRHLFRINYDQADVNADNLLDFQFLQGNERSSSTATYVNIQYGYLRQIHDKSRIKLEMGGMIDVQGHLTEYIFGLSDDEGYVFTYSFSYLARGIYDLDERQSLRLEASFPLLSFVVRPTYAIVDNEEIQNEGSDFGYIHGNGQLAAPGQFVKLQLGLQYARELSPRWDLILGYQLRYIKYNDPLRIGIVKNVFDLGLGFKF